MYVECVRGECGMCVECVWSVCEGMRMLRDMCTNN